MSSRPRAADDFSPIRARMAELQRERDAVEEQKAKAAQAEAMEAAAHNLAECEAEKPAGTDGSPPGPSAQQKPPCGFLPPGFNPIRREYQDGTIQHYFFHLGRWQGPYWTKTEMLVEALRIRAIQLKDLRLLWRPES